MSSSESDSELSSSSSEGSDTKRSEKHELLIPSPGISCIIFWRFLIFFSGDFVNVHPKVLRVRRSEFAVSDGETFLH
jgi:hypothetical protein